MSNELLRAIGEKHGIDFTYLQEIIECERKHVHKKRRPITGDLKNIVQKAVGEVAYDHQ